MSVRVHELAKELGLSSKELAARLVKLKIPVKGPMSPVDDEIVSRIRQAVARLRPAVVKKPAATKTASPAAGGTPSPARPGPARSVDGRGAVDTSSAARKVPPRSPAKGAKGPAVKKAPAAAPAKATVASRAAVQKIPTSPTTSAAAPAAAVKAPPALLKPALTAPVTAKPLVSAAKITAAKPPTPAPTPPPAPAPAVVASEAPHGVVAAAEPKSLQLTFPITVKDLAAKMEVGPNDLIKHLMSKGVFASLTQSLDEATAGQVAKAFNCELAPQPTIEERLLHVLAPDPAQFVSRAPVVTFMGHVDHGKTSLLDAIRQTKVVEKEAGGITQHIGAYEVVLPKGRVTFLDTPGHEAFTALRARGANVTDVVVLVVAADDGVMPQTVEAIDHAKAAEVPIVVAINKIDRPEANPQKIIQQLTQYGLVSEEWGGKTIMVPVSAKTGQGIDRLLEMLLLEAELLELKADPSAAPQGTVIEARLSKDRGPIATLLIQHGTLRVGELLVVGSMAGRVRALINDRGHRVKEAQPSSPVEVLGISGVPKAGERFIVVGDEKSARTLVEQRQERSADRTVAAPRRVTLDDLHQRITEGKLKELKLVLKADVQGSLEAITHSLEKIDTQAVKLGFIHTGVGDISASDVMLAAASDAVVIGFHVGVDPRVQVEAIAEGVDIRIFQIIYDLVNAIRAAIEGLLEPKIEETFLGRAEVKRLFQISKVGIVAGCVVTRGAVRRDAVIRVIRGKDRLTESKIANLKRVKDEVREVQEGVECGISLEGNVDLQPGDLLEAWELKKVARKLA